MLIAEYLDLDNRPELGPGSEALPLSQFDLMPDFTRNSRTAIAALGDRCSRHRDCNTGEISMYLSPGLARLAGALAP
jgi:hypothetical protein